MQVRGQHLARDPLLGRHDHGRSRAVAEDHGDVASLGGNLGIGGTLAAEFSYASTDQFLGTAGGLSMGQGLNRLFLATRENYPGGGTVDNPFICSGIMYNAKLAFAHMAGTAAEEELGARLSSDAERMNEERTRRGLPPR